MRMSCLCKVGMSGFMDGRGAHGDGANGIPQCLGAQLESRAERTRRQDDEIQFESVERARSVLCTPRNHSALLPAGFGVISRGEAHRFYFVNLAAADLEDMRGRHVERVDI
jgi:hypothetical protein